MAEIKKENFKHELLSIKEIKLPEKKKLDQVINLKDQLYYYFQLMIIKLNPFIFLMKFINRKSKFYLSKSLFSDLFPDKNKIFSSPLFIIYFSNIIKKKEVYKSKKFFKRIPMKKIISYIQLVIFELLFTYTLTNNVHEIINSNSSIINLKINKIGYSDIYYSEVKYKPDIIIINEVTQKNITNNYYFDELNNNIQLIWNNSINNSASMFHNCSNISEINFSILILLILQL